MTEIQTSDTTIDRLLDAALVHVPFDGWSQETFDRAVEDAGVPLALAQGLCPRGAIDLAVKCHRRGDDEMVSRLQEADLSGLRFRDRVAHAVWLRLEAAGDREVVRRGATLFSLPQHVAEGAGLIWGTADRIWTVLGDTSRDVNWYSKRAILSGVYSSTVVYWLGDESPDSQATKDFLDRRIEDVMRFEGAKARLRAAPIFGRLVSGFENALSGIKAPAPREDLPGGWTRPE